MADQEREELLRRFIKVIGNPAGSTFFDEDELVEIFDYAGDLNNDIIRIEVLWWGAKLYPDSTALAERKGFLYYDLGDSMVAGRVVGKIADKSVIGRLLTLRLSYPDIEKTVSELTDILLTTDDFEDEEIIQFVQTGGDFGAYPWLKDNVEKIKGKCSFPQSFLYEMIELADDNEDFGFVITLLEELTELEPFNTEFWEMMADYYVYRFNDPEKGLSAAEYALAVDPDATKALSTRARALYDLGHPVGEVESELRRIMEKFPEDQLPVHVLAIIYSTEGDDGKAASLLKEFLDHSPGDRATLSLYFTYCEGHIDREFLRRFCDDLRPDVSELIEWGRVTLTNHAPLATLSILEQIQEKDYNADYYSLLLEAMFGARQYKEVDKLFDSLCGVAGGDGQDFSAVLKGIRLLAACHDLSTPQRRVRALGLIKTTMLFYNDPMQSRISTMMDKSFELLGLESIIEKLHTLLKAGEDIDVDKFNPYLLPRQVHTSSGLEKRSDRQIEK